MQNVAYHFVANFILFKKYRGHF